MLASALQDLSCSRDVSNSVAHLMLLATVTSRKTGSVQGAPILLFPVYILMYKPLSM